MRPRAAALAACVWLAGCAGGLPRPAAEWQPGAPLCEAPAPVASERFGALAYDAGLPRRGQWRDGFDLADVDGDGLLDLLHGPARKGRLVPAIFRGDGRGGFRYWDDARFPELAYDYGDAQAADLNRDGRVDLVLSAHLRGVVALVHEGGGHFAPWGEGLGLRAPEDSPFEAVFASRALALVDWNRDGRIDIAALGEGPAPFAQGRDRGTPFRIWLNRDGFWEALPVPSAIDAFGDALATGDIDGDGAPDALPGTQRASAQRLWLRGGEALPAARVLEGLPARAAVTAVALADLDRDGRDEVLLATRVNDAGGYCTALLQLAPGRRAPRRLWSERSRSGWTALAVQDIDGDRRPDVAALHSDGRVQLFAGTRAELAPDRMLPVPATLQGCSGYDLALADLDADGRLEAIASYAGEDDGDGGCTSGGGFQAWRLDGG